MAQLNHEHVLIYIDEAINRLTSVKRLINEGVEYDRLDLFLALSHVRQPLMSVENELHCKKNIFKSLQGNLIQFQEKTNG